MVLVKFRNMKESMTYLTENPSKFVSDHIRNSQTYIPVGSIFNFEAGKHIPYIHVLLLFGSG